VPAVNFHSHLGKWLSPTGHWMEPDVGRLLAMMDSCNVAAMVNLDGRWGDELAQNLRRYDEAHPGRFYTFCHVDWSALGEAGGPDRLAASLRRSVGAGARGLKVWKDLGFEVSARGHRVLLDDPGLGPLWDTAGDLGVPVLVHAADPVAFFAPVDVHNERLEELLRHPRNSRATGGRAELERIVASFEAAVASHPHTTFVAAHGFYPEDLARVAQMFEEHPNFHVGIAWAHVQLGRQPRAAHKLLTEHSDRVLFGTDVFPLRSSVLGVYFRFLETTDEAFSYTDEVPPGSGRWPIYGLGLAGPVLERIYSSNATRLLGMGSR